MTDREKLTGLLNEFGVPFAVDPLVGGESIIVKRTVDNDPERVSGYLDFYTTFTFNSDGEFVSMGAWE